METIKGIHHVNITMPYGVEAAVRAFYGDLLGLEEIEKPQALQANGGVWFRMGNLDLHVSAQDDIDRNALKAHLAYQVDDLMAWRQKLEDVGIVTKDNTAIPEFDRFECRDPFGNRMEFVQVRQSDT